MKKRGPFTRISGRILNRSCVLIILLFAVSFCFPLEILANNSEETVETLQDQTEAAHKGFGSKMFIMPIPMVNPTIGTGLGAMTMYLFEAGENAPPSSLFLGGFYTDSESWAGGLGTLTYFKDDKYRLAGFLGYFDVNVDFYGIGSGAGDRGIVVPLNQSGSIFVPSFLFRIAENLYLGPRYRLVSFETRIDKSGVPSGHAHELLPDEIKVKSSGLGIVLDYDSKDNKFYPYSGAYLDVNTNFANKAFGSDRDYQQLEVGFNLYKKIGEEQVLAWRATGCFAGGDTPFYELCMFGSVFDAMRGYVTGQYRDNISLTTQLEYRRRIYKKLGMVAFGGIGQVAPDLNELNSDDILGSAGLGIRFMPSKEAGVNLSLDYARGKDSDAWYFRIGEAF
jgi:hypothetical protein